MTEGHDILFPKLPYDMHERAERATQDPQLQRFVENATLTKDRLRRKIRLELWGADRHDDLRELGGQIKQHTLDHLDYYIEKFVASATAAGSQVYFAANGDEANEICLDIARREGCKLCVKSKSMVTEETQLLPALEAIGCTTVETDLGEFILQLDHDAPSHIVAPMIHKNRVSVAKVFTKVLGAPYTEDPRELTQIARKYLRDQFRKADLGVSGANFLVADTGSMVLCTNEGNGRLCTSGPRVHVAFVGIEKLVPDLQGLGVLLKLLARSSTGQPLTCYTSIITGPKRAHEHDGPEQVHIILVDNGRTQLLREETREMLRCIRCGACLNACPVYRKVGGHAYGAVYSGPIGALITPIFHGLANYKDLPQASSLCGACYEACPVKINIPKHLIRLRREIVGGHLDNPRDRIMMRVWAWSLRQSWSYRFGGWMQKVGFRTLARLAGKLRPGAGSDSYRNRGWLSKLPGPVAGWTSQRDMPTPPSNSFRDWWRQERKP